MKIPKSYSAEDSHPYHHQSTTTLGREERQKDGTTAFQHKVAGKTAGQALL